MEAKFFIPDYKKNKENIKDCWSGLSWKGGDMESGTWGNNEVTITGYWSRDPTEIVYEGPEDTNVLNELEELAQENEYGYKKKSLSDLTVEDIDIHNPLGHLGNPPEKVKESALEFIIQHNQSKVNDDEGVREKVMNMYNNGELWSLINREGATHAY